MQLQKQTKQLLLYMMFPILLIGIFFIAYITYNETIISRSTTQNTGDYVVLLHGLGRTKRSMYPIGRMLAHEGYRVINIGYPSRTDTIENLVATKITPPIDALYVDKNKKIHFVTHSMGGIVTRYYLANHAVANLGRVVMLAPPNAGSDTADTWAASTIMRPLLGPAILQMTTASNSLAQTLPSPTYEVGIIAGEFDEKVDPEKTQVDDMKYFFLAAREHTFIMHAPEVLAAVSSFLRTGSFPDPPPNSDTSQPLYTTYTVPAEQRDSIQFFWKDGAQQPIQTIDTLRKNIARDGKHLLFATNGGIFDTNYHPLGLYIENWQIHTPVNRNTGEGNFYMQPNGIFFTTKFTAGITNTVDFVTSSYIRNALQSGPLLLEKGNIHPEFTRFSQNKHIRNGIGITPTGDMLFAISNVPVSFYEFATYFRDELGATDALYLDGAISELFIAGEREQTNQSFVGIIGILE